MGYFTLDLGLTEEQNDQIETFIRKNFVTRSHYDKKTHEYEEKIEELTQLSKDSSENKKSYDKILKDYDTLKVQYENAQKEHVLQLQKIKMEHTLQDVLKQEGARNVRIILPLLKEQELSLQEDGSILGLKEQIQSLKKDPETSFLFYEDKLQGTTSALPEMELKNNTNLEEPTTLDTFASHMSNFSRYLHPPNP